MIPFAESCLEVLTRMHEEMKKALEGLPGEALDWVPGNGMNTMAVLVTHTAGAERFLIGTMVGGKPSERVRSNEFTVNQVTVDLLNGILDEALEESTEVLAALELDQLNRMVFSERHGREFQTGWSLLHALEHTANHVGHLEVTRQFWDQRSGQRGKSWQAKHGVPD